MSQEWIDAYKRGERVLSDTSLFKERLGIPTCQHQRERTVACNGDEDVVECDKCGRQRLTSCNFDDDMS